MLMLAFALIAQDTTLPPVSPGLCRAAADRFEPLVTRVRTRFQDDAKAEAEGRETEYDRAKRTAMMGLLEEDARQIKIVQRRYPATTLGAGDASALAAMDGGQISDYVEACAK
jgi:hypothetical protein